MRVSHPKNPQPSTWANSVYSSVLDSSSPCLRCQGLLVRVFCMDMLDSNDENGFWALRCCQCGELLDPMILHHRNSNPELVNTGGGRPQFPVPLTSSLRGTLCSGKDAQLKKDDSLLQPKASGGGLDAQEQGGGHYDKGLRGLD